MRVDLPQARRRLDASARPVAAQRRGCRSRAAFSAGPCAPGSMAGPAPGESACRPACAACRSRRRPARARPPRARRPGTRSSSRPGAARLRWSVPCCSTVTRSCSRRKSSDSAASGTTARARGTCFFFESSISCFKDGRTAPASSSRHQNCTGRPASRRRASSSSNSLQFISTTRAAVPRCGARRRDRSFRRPGVRPRPRDRRPRQASPP